MCIGIDKPGRKTTISSLPTCAPAGIDQGFAELPLK